MFKRICFYTLSKNVTFFMHNACGNSEPSRMKQTYIFFMEQAMYINLQQLSDSFLYYLSSLPIMDINLMSSKTHL